RLVLRAMLESFGFLVEEASSGGEALARIEAAEARGTPFELLLIDWRMPGLDGVATLSALGGDPSVRHPPSVIMVTAHGREEALEASAGLPVAGVLAKPTTPSSLFDTIILALTGQRRQGRAVQRDAQTQEAAAALAGARVLLVEDNAVNQELARELLARHGIQVEVANDGAEALARLADEAFDGVLMDCQMPVMDGYTATRRLREQPRLRDLPVIAMTANAMAGDREKVLAAGMNDHIPKPINVEQMLKTMARWIKPAAPRLVQASPVSPLSTQTGRASCGQAPSGERTPRRQPPLTAIQRPRRGWRRGHRPWHHRRHRPKRRPQHRPVWRRLEPPPPQPRRSTTGRRCRASTSRPGWRGWKGIWTSIAGCCGASRWIRPGSRAPSAPLGAVGNGRRPRGWPTPSRAWPAISAPMPCRRPPAAWKWLPWSNRPSRRMRPCCKPCYRR
ncbi:MAG TPA: response regulator, partial [Chromatiaceae bacterium]|nr:response regulator [Chromatiaceae bacterium]